tara:strand:- start:120 stop:374 length:255 start_codon:yes stop_codon:yes gene_type:complete
MRKRSKDRYTTISISLKETTLNEIESLLSYKQSRSKFIAACVEAKLDGSKFVSEAETRQLMAALTMREDCDPFLKKLAMQILLS